MRHAWFSLKLYACNFCSKLLTIRRLLFQPMRIAPLIIDYLLKQSNLRLWLYALTISMVMAEVITCCMGRMLHGEITYDYLLTGFVVSMLVGGMVSAALVGFLGRVRNDAKNFREMSKQLARSEERARQAIEASNAALWDFDLTSGSVYLSEGWSPFLSGKLKPTQTTFEELSQLVPEEERPMLKEAILTALKGEVTSRYQVTHRVRKPDGSYIWVRSEGQVTERDRNGWALRMVGINRDITELKQAEDRIKQQIEEITQANTRLLQLNRQLEQAQDQLIQSEKMASIGHFAAGVAQEINKPVACVNSNFSTLNKYLSSLIVLLNKYEAAEPLMTCHDQELDELQQFKKKINVQYVRRDTVALLAESQAELDRVRQIVLDLDAFSRTGSQEKWAWVDIQQLLVGTLNLVWNELKYKCEVRKIYATLPKVYCLPSRINQVFMNLLLNAAQAIKERGVITLGTGQEGNQIWVEITDTGEGIAAQNMSRIFDPFFTTKPVGNGTGLGLAVSYSIVEKHGGRIEVASEVGTGTTMRVWLPIKLDNS